MFALIAKGQTERKEKKTIVGRKLLGKEEHDFLKDRPFKMMDSLLAGEPTCTDSPNVGQGMPALWENNCF